MQDLALALFAEPPPLAFECPEDDEVESYDFNFSNMWEHCYDLAETYLATKNSQTRNTLTQRCKQKPRAHKEYVPARAVKKEEIKTFNIEFSLPTKTVRPVHTPSYTPSAPCSTSAVVAPTPAYVAPVYQPRPVKTQYEIDLERALAASQTEKHASGLTFGQLSDLANRELTPEDYEMLLMLDSMIEKKTTETDVLGSLRVTLYEETGTNEECRICMCPLETGDSLKHLPCNHFFHEDCVSTWLGKHSQSCPLCNTKVL